MAWVKKGVIAGIFLAATLGAAVAAEESNNILNMAVNDDSYALGRVALALGANLISQEQNLQLAAGAGEQKEIKLILGLGADRQARQDAHFWAARGLNLLFPQTTEKQKEQTLALIQSYAKSPAEKQSMLDNSLEQIVMGPNVDTVRYLLEQGANPNAYSQVLLTVDKNDKEQRILAWAAQNGEGKAPDMVELLLRHGADPKLALHYLASEQDDAAEALIIQKSNEIRQKAPSAVPAPKP